MKVTTTPSCRVGWEGATLHYVVRAEGANEVVVPENGMEGVQIRVADTRQVANGVEADLEVKVLDSSLY